MFACADREAFSFSALGRKVVAGWRFPTLCSLACRADYSCRQVAWCRCVRVAFWGWDGEGGSGLVYRTYGRWRLEGCLMWAADV